MKTIDYFFTLCLLNIIDLYYTSTSFLLFQAKESGLQHGNVNNKINSKKHLFHQCTKRDTKLSRRDYGTKSYQQQIRGKKKEGQPQS